MAGSRSVAGSGRRATRLNGTNPARRDVIEQRIRPAPLLGFVTGRAQNPTRRWR